MELLAQFWDVVLHLDRHLEVLLLQYGPWIYGLLFLIIFCETGLVIAPFLPGDSMLFVVGALCGTGMMSLPLAITVLLVAAILGDQCNYTIGRYFGPKVFQWEQSRFFNKRAFDAAHAFYEKHGGITIILARFMPFVRTFAPFVAGVAAMSRAAMVHDRGDGHARRTHRGSLGGVLRPRRRRDRARARSTSTTPSMPARSSDAARRGDCRRTTSARPQSEGRARDSRQRPRASDPRNPRLRGWLGGAALRVDRAQRPGSRRF